MKRTTLFSVTMAPRPQHADQRDVAEAADVALREHAVLDAAVDQATIAEAVIVAADERNVHLQTERRVEVVAEEELGREAVQALALVDGATVRAGKARLVARRLLADADLESTPGLAHLGRGVDRADVAARVRPRARPRPRPFRATMRRGAPDGEAARRQRSGARETHPTSRRRPAAR